ncbi:hypothetical protein BASA81_004471 [Batrachochytrium salamandrivorans]|nr:hypothetical protein BASA81_004471 [Batrachochytrium salamandrivorans]
MKKRPRLQASLERALEERVLALRREYEQPSQDNPAKSASLALTSFDFLGAQLVGDIELVSLLRSHALSEARGALPLVEATADTQDHYQWTRSPEWEEPNLQLRQITKRIDSVQLCELPGAKLQHWSQTLLLLPVKPRSDASLGELVCFHPKRRSDFGEVQFVNDLASVMESLHLGQYSISGENCTFELNSTNWMATVRHLQRAVSKYAAKTFQKEGREVLLLVWPDEAWGLVRSALGCFTGMVFQSTRRVVEVQAVRESHLLSNSRRKQVLLGLSFSLFSNRGLGAFCLKSTEERQVHLAVISSPGRWISFAWCCNDGQDLSVDCLADFELSASPAQTLMDTMKRRMGHATNAHIVLLAFGFPPQYFAKLPQVTAITETESGMSREIRKQLDDLSYLTEVSTLPTSGVGEGFVFNALTAAAADKEESGKRTALPLHLQCALRLLVGLQGVVPPAQVEHELRFYGLRKLTSLFVQEDELKCTLITEKMQVQEAKVEDWINKLPRHLFDSLASGEDTRQKLTLYL